MYDDMLFSALAYIEPAKLRLFFHICNFFFTFIPFSAFPPLLRHFSCRCSCRYSCRFSFCCFFRCSCSFLLLLCSRTLLLFLLLFLPCHYRITTVSATLLVPSQFPHSSLAVPSQPLLIPSQPLFLFFFFLCPYFPFFFSQPVRVGSRSRVQITFERNRRNFSALFTNRKAVYAPKKRSVIRVFSSPLSSEPDMTEDVRECRYAREWQICKRAAGYILNAADICSCSSRGMW